MYKLKKSDRLRCSYWVISPQLVDTTMTVNMMPEEEQRKISQGDNLNVHIGPGAQRRERRLRDSGTAGM